MLREFGCTIWEVITVHESGTPTSILETSCENNSPGQGHMLSFIMCFAVSSQDCTGALPERIALPYIGYQH